jgi:hypothetical protein
MSDGVPPMPTTENRYVFTVPYDGVVLDRVGYVKLVEPATLKADTWYECWIENGVGYIRERPDS